LVVVATCVAFGAAFLTDLPGLFPVRKELDVLAWPGRTLVLIAINALDRSDGRTGPLLDEIVDEIAAYSNGTKGYDGA
jgi:hypothetical protein